jgi:hypothetical protein
MEFNYGCDAKFTDRRNCRYTIVPPDIGGANQPVANARNTFARAAGAIVPEYEPKGGIRLAQGAKLLRKICSEKASD